MFTAKKTAAKTSVNTKTTKKTQITENSTIGEALRQNENASKILMGFGMACFGCPMAQRETIKEAAEHHGVDVALMIEKLNA